MTHEDALDIAKDRPAGDAGAADPQGGPESADGFSRVRSRKVRLRPGGPPDLSQVNERISKLQAELEEREEVIVTLTSRLEQAAEQLDRFRRCGNNAPTRRGGGGGELLGDQKTMEDLKQMIVQWDEMQCGATLGRLETQVTELRDLIAGMAGGGRIPAPLSPFSLESTDAHAPERKPAAGNWWEATKAAMMAGETPPLPSSEVSQDSEVGEDRLDGEPMPLPGLPEPLNYDELTVEAAAMALRERDQALLRMRELLLVRQAGQELGQFQSLEDLPDAIRNRLTAIETEWQAKFRQMELDLSRERARLARTEATLRHQQEQLEKDMSRLGSGSEEDSSGHSGDEPRRRWFRFLGRKDQG